MTALVISRNNCRYCTMTKMLLKSVNMKSETIDVSEFTDEQNREIVAKYNIPHWEDEEGNIRFRKPQVFLYGSHVGGFTELKAHYS